MENAQQKYANCPDDNLKKATGSTWQEWFDVLDKVNATCLPHKDIVGWLQQYHIDKAWWCQKVALGYEQARGMRNENQKCDGFYAVSVSKILDLPLKQLYKTWTDRIFAKKWLELEQFAITTANQDKNIRAKWLPDDSRLSIHFYEKGLEKSQMVIDHEKMNAQHQVEPMRAYWKSRLAQLIKLLEKP